MTDLFPTVDRLRLPGADVEYRPGFLSDDDAEALLRRLIDAVPWRQDNVVLWGRRIPQPRLTAWYGDPGRRYAYSGLVLDPLPWSEDLRALRREVEAASGTAFNSVLLNYYRDHNDSVGFHADDEPELGPAPVIASLNLGATRTLAFRPRRRADGGTARIALASGSLLVMRGETQRNWRHAVARETRPCGPRVNLTFRRILD